jgi:ribonuclease HI
MKQVSLFADGACSGNPGPGGFGAILVCAGTTKELSAGYMHTTNNRMELRGVIAGLEALKEPCEVTVTTDSQYVVNAMEQGWAKKWRANGWKRNKKEAAQNPDLWGRLLDLCETNAVTFEWVRGHSGHPMNERCDELAVAAVRNGNLSDDVIMRSL